MSEQVKQNWRRQLSPHKMSENDLQTMFDLLQTIPLTPADIHDLLRHIIILEQTEAALKETINLIGAKIEGLIDVLESAKGGPSV